MADSTDKPKGHITWERGIEILKVVATLWVAGVGTIVTMQFNERQHELARIQAIAQMLPSLSETGKAGDHSLQDNKAQGGSKSSSSMSRDGAIWAIFRTANNKTMLKDLASLFPEDIYRVVSSIAVAGGLEHDEEAITALQVSSEKLAARYSDEQNSELATRLYNQAVKLKQHLPGDTTPIYIVDLTESEVTGPQTDEQIQSMLASLNKLAELHLQESEKSKHINAGHWQAKQLFKRVRKLAGASPSKEVKLEVAKADLCLSRLYQDEGHIQTAAFYLNDALKIKEEVLGSNDSEVSEARKQLTQLKSQVNTNAETVPSSLK